MGHGLDRIWVRLGQVAGTYECGNEPEGSVQCGELLDWLRTGWLLKNESPPWSK